MFFKLGCEARENEFTGLNGIFWDWPDDTVDGNRLPVRLLWRTSCRFEEKWVWPTSYDTLNFRIGGR
jgi:hypothetical protein